MGKHSQYGVILDAGSSGTRLYIYTWKDPVKPSITPPNPVNHSLPKLKIQKSKKIHPGVSTFANDVGLIGTDHLRSLMEAAIKEIPSTRIPETPIFLMATAGVRYLPKHQQDALLDEICHYLQSNTMFKLPDCAAHVQVISGETEGLYGWIATNYLLGGFDHPERHNHGKGHNTYGFLDMGGASAQIAFVPNATESQKHSKDLKLVRMRRMDGSSAEYKVFVATWLGFGANKARQRYVESLQKQYDGQVDEIPDPCLPKGLRTTLSGHLIELKSRHPATILIGTGVFNECLRRTHPLLGKNTPCEDQPCLLDGQHVPAIDFDVNHFIGISEYWHTTHGVFGTDSKAYDLISYQRKVTEYCNRDWSSIENDLGNHKKTSEQEVANARESCFKASWLINVLYEGIGIPRLGLEDISVPSTNISKEYLGKTGAKEFREPFRPMNKIEGVEVSWTLGKMILYACGQIPPQESSDPVGFGTNVNSGVPDDFEHAGSVPLISGTSADNDEYSDEIITKPGWSLSGLVVLGLILLIIGYILRSSERRRRIFSFFRRYRKPGISGWQYRGFSFTHKLLRRNSQQYERIVEEGEMAGFELGVLDPDDMSNSNNAEDPKAIRNSHLTAPKSIAERSDESQPSSIMDRQGLVLRTESCERLAPTLQMLNAGRRSRAGSPTRLKSPFIGPSQIS